MFAQNYMDICATEENTDPDPPGVYSYSTDPIFLETVDPAVINVYFWKINDKDGNGHVNELTEQRALEGIQHLNINFNPAGIFFKYRGMGSFNSPPDVIYKQFNYECNSCENFPFDPVDPCNNSVETLDPDGYQLLSRCQRSQMWNYAASVNAYKADAMNVYVPAGTTDFGGAASSLGSNKIVIHPGLVSGTFLHEIGHALNLSHTFPGWNGNSCEQVSRDPNDLCDPNDTSVPCFNANIRGDKVVDTAAMPEFAREYCLLPGGPPLGECAPGGQFRFHYYENCEYTGTIFPNTRTDCKLTPYQISPADARNYMGYNDTGCSDTFTVGQGIRMKEALANLPILQPIKTTIQSLYEPYTGSYPAYYPHPLPWEDPLFQPGFDYTFVECDCNCTAVGPLPYEDISFTYTNNSPLHIGKEETDFSIITHPNHTAIRIDFPFELPDDYRQSTRRCYDNYWSPPVIGGSIIKFNDGVFNANVTITTQDSTAINNPTLIDDLDPGLYNIQKTIIDGSTQEQVILKENI